MSQFNMPHTRQRTGSDLVNEEATVTCLLFCHQEHLIKHFELWEIGPCSEEKEGIGFLVIAQVFIATTDDPYLISAMCNVGERL